MKKIFVGVVIFLIMMVLVIAAAGRPTAAQTAGSDSALAAKVDEILKNQRAILNGLEAIKQELNVIKIRITQAQ